MLSKWSLSENEPTKITNNTGSKYEALIHFMLYFHEGLETLTPTLCLEFLPPKCFVPDQSLLSPVQEQQPPSLRWQGL